MYSTSYIPHLYPFIPVDWHISCFHIVAIVNNNAMKMGADIILSSVFIPLDIYPDVGFLGHMVLLFLIFEELIILLKIMVYTSLHCY